MYRKLLVEKAHKLAPQINECQFTRFSSTCFARRKARKSLIRKKDRADPSRSNICFIISSYQMRYLKYASRSLTEVFSVLFTELNLDTCTSSSDTFYFLIQEMRSQESREVRGMFFVVGDDLKNSQTLKNESARKNIFTILRHFQLIREIRGPQSLVRYAVHLA